MGIGLYVSGGGVEIVYSQEGASRPLGGEEGGVPMFGPLLEYRRGETSRRFSFEEIGESGTPVGRWLIVTLDEGSDGRRLFGLLFPALSGVSFQGVASAPAHTIGVEALIREKVDAAEKAGFGQRGEYSAIALDGTVAIEPPRQ